MLDDTGSRIHAADCATSRQRSDRFDWAQDLPKNPHNLDGEWLFGGISSPHFGHQITRCLGRLPHSKAATDLDGIVFCRLDRRSATSASIQLLRRLLEFFDVDLPIKIIDTPTRVERLLIGEDLFGEAEDCIPSPAFISWSKEQMSGWAVPMVPGKRLYVTRRGIGPRRGRVLCEDLLEKNLLKQGFEIFQPEQHDLAEQFRAYQEAETIVTTDGSHCHVIAFARQEGQKLSVISRREAEPVLVRNQLRSFGEAIPSCRTFFLSVLLDEWQPNRRDRSISKGEVDFAALAEALKENGSISPNNPENWYVPTGSEVRDSALEGLRAGEFVMNKAGETLHVSPREQSTPTTQAETMADTRTTPEINGLPYLRMLRRMHAALRPDWYLEVGTFSGKSLRLANCNYVAVDPEFRIDRPVVPSAGRQMHLFQQTSDDFFASGFLRRNAIELDLAFLDGMHRFEFLLRDFMNTEKAMKPGGVIAMHDCCPSTYEMASRDQGRGAWTGDVWKTLLILLEHRPDLDIQVAKCAPTGLVVIRNCDPGNRVLDDSHDELVASHMDQSLEDLPGGLPGLYERFELAEPSTVLEQLAAPRNAS